ASCLISLYERLGAALDGVSEWEVIFVDDCSPDVAWDLLEELAPADNRVRAQPMRRNFGQHAAIAAGLAETRGSRIVVMDCALQDPPEEMPRLLATAREGHDVALAPLRPLLGQTMDTEYSTLSVISRGVVHAFLPSVIATVSRC